jgi:hypothetical protein
VELIGTALAEVNSSSSETKKWSKKVIVMRKKNVVMVPTWPESKNDCGGKGQQQVTCLTDRARAIEQKQGESQLLEL